MAIPLLSECCNLVILLPIFCKFGVDRDNSRKFFAALLLEFEFESVGNCNKLLVVVSLGLFCKICGPRIAGTLIRGSAEGRGGAGAVTVCEFESAPSCSGAKINFQQKVLIFNRSKKV